MTDNPSSPSGDFPTLQFNGFTEALVSAYAQVSGDRNPIHLQRSAAEAAGFSQCVVQGMLIAGQFEGVVRHWWPHATVIATTTRFVRPLFLNSAFSIAGRIVAKLDDADHVILRLLVRDGENNIVCLSDARLSAPG